MSDAVPWIDVTTFHRYDELTEILRRLTRDYPRLTVLESIGTSFEGRDIWLLTITNQETGPADEKPALYIDGNIHAGEVTGSNVCLYTADLLLHGYGADPEITELLDTRAFYITPRVQPDGAEMYLTTPLTLRSSVRPWPLDEEDEGLTPEDIDGDGLILQMRVKDAKGEWRVSEQDARLMVKRRPDELTAPNGDFYRIYTEGILNDYVRGPVKLARTKYGIDQNRNWPSHWSVYQRGGGPFPLSEPETRAVATFVESHRNICIVQDYHTWGGVILRAPGAVGDGELAPRDVEVYKRMGEIGEQVTGYPCASVYDAFPELDERGRRNTSGGFIDWTWNQLGMYSFATELWDPESRAGVERPQDNPMRVSREQTEEEGLKLLRFNDETLGGRGFVAWRAHEHPQLGTVEIGGWKTKEVRQNAPAELLQDECERNARFSIRQATMTPLLAFGDVEVERIAADAFVIRAMVENHGFLPTYGSEQALRNTIAKPIEVEIEGAEPILGKQKQEIGQLQGRSAARGMLFAFGMVKVENERLVEWLVRGTGSCSIVARSEKGGTVRREVGSGSVRRCPLLHMLRQPAQVEVAVRRDVVEALVFCLVRGGLDVVGVVLRLVGDLAHGGDEEVERFDALRLGRLDHQRFVDDQREVGRRRMHAEVEQALGDVERAHAGRGLLAAGGEHELVHAGSVVGDDVTVPQVRQQVVRRQHRVLADPAQPLGAVHADVAVGAHVHAEVAEERMYLADRALRRLHVVGRRITLTLLVDDRVGQELRQVGAYADRACPRPAAAVWGREGLVQVEVHDVDAEVAGTDDAEDGVEVGAVVVDQPAGIVDDLDDLLDVLVPQAERVRVGDHQRGGRRPG
jgi:murein tripeptide amidase MpaA